MEKITAPNVRDWIKELMQDTPAKKGLSITSIKRIVGFCRNFWAYLQEIEKADFEKQPFVVPTFAKKTSSKPESQRGGWVPFSPAEVVTLLSKAQANEDHELTDLIRLGMYTGARIEELCALKAAPLQSVQRPSQRLHLKQSGTNLLLCQTDGAACSSSLRFASNKRLRIQGHYELLRPCVLWKSSLPPTTPYLT